MQSERERHCREMVAGAYAMQSWSRISYKQQQEEAASGKGSRSRSRGMMVHVGSMPLRAPPGPAQWALLSADRLLSIQHFYTILQPIPVSPSEQTPCMVFDFQPRNPEDLYTVLVGLSGGAVPGVILERTIMHPPVRRCWKVGMTKDGISMKDAAEFNRKWDCNLLLWKHDCCHHTDAFVEFLTDFSPVSTITLTTAKPLFVCLEISPMKKWMWHTNS